MTEFLLQLCAPLSLLLLLLILAQKVLLKPLGARSIYAIWFAVPLFLLMSVLLPFLPVSFHSEPIKRYQVGVQQISASVSDSSALFSLWLLGCVLCSAYLLLSYLSSRAQYHKAIPVNLARHAIQCRQAVDCSGPCISGLFAPHILLPADFFTRFDATQQHLVLMHELTHWRRGDLHLNYFALLILCLCWFNPLCWLAYRKYRQAQELSCDAVVTEHAGKAEKIAYGHALLSSTKQPSSLWWPLSHYYGDFNMMKQRITQLQQQKGLSKPLVLTAMALVLGSTLLLQQPALAGAKDATQLAPVMRIEPRYPVKAAEEGIAGFVQLKFDVSADGKVSNVNVIKSNPSDIFDKEAVRALKEWQYNATGQEHKGQLVQLDFELDIVPPEMERISVKAATADHG